MEKKILIAGKELPDGSEFAQSVANHKRRVAVTAEFPRGGEEEPPAAPNGATAFPWNRNSALSTRSLLLGVFNAFSSLDEIILIFDETHLSQKFGENTSNADSVKILEEAISSYQYATSELISKIAKAHEKSPAKAPVKFVFLHKSNVSLCESLLGAKNNSAGHPSSPLISSASAAFRSFAENTAAFMAESVLFLPMLVSVDVDNDYQGRDGSLAGWVCDYLNSLDNLKNPLSAKDKISWIKAGSKKPGSGFSLFR